MWGVCHSLVYLDKIVCVQGGTVIDSLLYLVCRVATKEIIFNDVHSQESRTWVPDLVDWLRAFG